MSIPISTAGLRWYKLECLGIPNYGFSLQLMTEEDARARCARPTDVGYQLTATLVDDDEVAELAQHEDCFNCEAVAEKLDPETSLA